jgi:hypothetical protein
MQQLTAAAANVEQFAPATYEFFGLGQKIQSRTLFIAGLMAFEIVVRIQLIMLIQTVSRHGHGVWKNQSAFSATPDFAFNPKVGSMRRTTTATQAFLRAQTADRTVLWQPSVTLTAIVLVNLVGISFHESRFNQ